jgi:hypothetical protein
MADRKPFDLDSAADELAANCNLTGVNPMEIKSKRKAPVQRPNVTNPTTKKTATAVSRRKAQKGEITCAQCGHVADYTSHTCPKCGAGYPFLNDMKRKAQDIRTKSTTVHYPVSDQVIEDESLTKGYNNDYESTILLDRKDAGSQYSPLYWAERIYQGLKEFRDSQDVYEAVIEQAKATGLNDDQEKAIRKWCLSFGLPIGTNKTPTEDLKPNDKTDGVQSESDAVIKYSQPYPGSNGQKMTTKFASLTMSFQDLAANLSGDELYERSVERMGRTLLAYNRKRVSIQDNYYRGLVKSRIALLQQQGFSYPEIVKDSTRWAMPKQAIEFVLSELRPRVALSNTVKLTNGRIADARQATHKALGLMAAKAKVPDHASAAQTLRLQNLASRYAMSTPWWIDAGTYPLQAKARLEDGRVLRASIKMDGSYTSSARFERELKCAIKTAGNKDVGWVGFASPKA